MSQPHASWAEIYDFVYEKSFGAFYEELTRATIEQVERLVKPPTRVIDFGAGTGRLSIPLSRLGYSVLAVEPCKEMLEQMHRKPGGNSIRSVHGRMQDVKISEHFDLALCVFTVVLYLLDRKSLESAIKTAAKALKPGGLRLNGSVLNVSFPFVAIQGSLRFLPGRWR